MIQRALTSLLLAGMLITSQGVSAPPSDGDPAQETRFWTGCDPGPAEPPPGPEHNQSTLPAAMTARSAALTVDVDSAARHKPILGSGFNIEHALWSCPEFRGVFEQRLLDPFQPAIARVDTGLLPAASAELAAAQLAPGVYRAMLNSAPYADSWAFLRLLNRNGVRIVLGVWGGPAQFTDENDRLGTLQPTHYDDYIDYIGTLVDFVVREQGVQVWATTIANEPDGGDGNAISPDGMAYVAHGLAARLAPLGVRLYGPDTSSSASALQYLPPLLDDPTVANNLAFVAFHEYYAVPEVRDVVDYVHARRPGLPVLATEYGSFGFGDLDAGQEANDGVGFMLDVANTVLSHYRSGVDAALYWDAVDYLQPGHGTITRWGLLRGPQRDFAQRRRCYGLLQILKYLQPGTRVLDASLSTNSDELGYLVVQTPAGVPAIFFVNWGVDQVDTSIALSGANVSISSFGVWRTGREREAERIGRLRLTDGVGRLTLPPRSITTLYPPSAPIDPDDQLD
jgi:O-glycosyl hydrolase